MGSQELKKAAVALRGSQAEEFPKLSDLDDL